MEEKSLEVLFAEAEKLVGRPVEFEETDDGKFVALWMSFAYPPPPKGKDVREACENFIEHVRPYFAQVRAIETKLDDISPAPVF